MTGPRDPLHDALLELESSAPFEPPPARRKDRRGLWVAAGGVAVAAVLAGVVIGGALLDRQDTGQTSPTPSPTSSPSASPTPSPVPTASSTPAETPLATTTPAPTLAPRTGWTTVPSDAFPEVGRLDGVEEAEGRLFALGGTTAAQPMIWFSDDGERWQATSVEPVPSPYGGQVKALVDAGDRLVAVATLGFAEGSGYLATMIYTSDDGGQQWRAAESTPGLTEAALFDLTMAGSRVVAVGSGVWTSDDRGLTWTEAASGDSLGGTMRAVAGNAGRLLAAGMVGTDIANPPALAWNSRDQGSTWQRTTLDERAGATGALVTSSGEFLVSGYDATAGERSILWSSTDDGATWNEREIGDVQCCGIGLVETPTGIVVGVAGQSSGVLGSSDGQSWSLAPVEFSLRGIAWTPTYGLLAITDNSEVVFGPEPYP